MAPFVDAGGIGRPALFYALDGKPRGEDRHAKLAAFPERAGRDDAAPQRRAGLLHRLWADGRGMDLVELSLVGKRRLAPCALEDVDRLLHALAAVVAAKPLAPQLVFVFERSPSHAGLHAAPC